MTDNTKLWDALNRPPATALKKITGGRLKGMTDINPQWRYRALTEQLGPCGIGWKYTIDELWTVPGSADQVCAFARISLFVKYGEQWSEAVPGVGGSMLITKESGGLHTSDEAFKMAITDALSTACKMLGVAGDIYMGLWDGTKYAGGQEPAPDTSKFAEWAAMCDTAGEGTVDDVVAFWKKNSAQIKQDLSKPQAAKIYQMMLSHKARLKDMEAPEPGTNG